MKEVNDDTKIYRSTYNYPLGEWHETVEFFGGINSSLSIIAYDYHYELVFLWESFENGIWKPMRHDVVEEETDILELESDNKFTPDALLFDIAINKKQNDTWFNFFTYTASEDNENSDIFINNLWWGYQNCFNISQSNASDSNPRLFYLPASYKYNNYLVFQSLRNGRQQLFISNLSF